MNNQGRTFKTVCALAAAALFLGACGATPSEPGEPDKVVLGIAPILSSLPYYIAVEEGFFAEQNIEVEFINVFAATDILAPLSTGDMDAAISGLATGQLNLMAEDPNVRAVVDRGYTDPNECQASAALIRREVLASGALDSAETVRELTVSVIPSGPAAFALDRWLSDTYGLSVEDLNTTLLPPPALQDALNNGAIDIVTAQEPNVTFLLQTTDTEVLLTYVGYLDYASHAYMVYGERMLREDPDLGRRFMVAYLQGVQQYREGATERNLEIAAQYTGQDPELLKVACWSTMRPDGIIDYQASLPWQQWEFEAGRLSRVLTEEEFWDPSFVEYAYGQLDN